MSKHESICFNCKNACNSAAHHCPWSAEFKPVEGWTVEAGITYIIDNKKERGIRVIACPLYEQDHKYFSPKEIVDLLSKHFNCSTNYIYKNYQKMIARYEKETKEILPEWCKAEDVFSLGEEEAV